MTGWQETVGSGAIIAADGYIITNAHVVERAQQIKVRLVPQGAQTIPSVLAQSYAAPKDATLVGVFEDGDLALLKIQAEGLPVLPIADFNKLRQGQIVFAFGSPQGLQNSVTMGVISSIARQLDPDNPWLYIQTDTPINPGNSGGPLVNTAGEMVGINTFISTQSGGSEGVGFALPGVLVRMVSDHLRKYGHVHRPVIGVGLQTITPLLKAALHLPRDSGVLVSDVFPESPAAVAGVKLNDVLLTVNGRPLDNVAAMTGLSFEHVPGTAMKIQVLRGGETLALEVTPIEAQDDADRLNDLSDLPRAEVASLGIVVVTLDEHSASAVPSVRLPSGALVVARTANARGADIGFQAGDVIHELGGANVFSIKDLQSALDKVKTGDPVAALVERDARWFYVAFEMR
jgi:serine protease Do